VWHTIHNNDCGRFTYSQEPAAESSQIFCLDTYLSELAKSRTTQEPCCSSDNVTESCRSSQFGTTSEHSTENHGGDSLTSSRVDFLARTYPAPEEGQGSPAKEAGYGVKWRESLAKYDHGSRSWKTRQCLLAGGLEEFSETWPRWGMMHDGVCWARATPAQITSARECGYLPTVRRSGQSRAFKCFNRGDNYKGNLEEFMAKLGFTGYITNQLCEALMMWPIGWSDISALETDKFQRWLRLHGKY